MRASRTGPTPLGFLPRTAATSAVRTGLGPLGHRPHVRPLAVRRRSGPQPEEAVVGLRDDHRDPPLDVRKGDRFGPVGDVPGLLAELLQEVRVGAKRTLRLYADTTWPQCFGHETLITCMGKPRPTQLESTETPQVAPRAQSLQ
jgi:hypothetical protein